MKNKIYLRKTVLKAFVVTFVCLLAFVLLGIGFYHRTVSNQNKKIMNILEQVQKQYPEVEKEELIRLLSEVTDETGDFAALYGIDVDTEAIVVENTIAFRDYLSLAVLLLLAFSGIMLCLFLHYNARKDRELEKITEHLEAINHHDYHYDMDSISEDELSILKNEVYKTTVMLKETAENSMRAKNSLKDSLSDISHQLKTPLASISLTLDNLIDNPQMDTERRNTYLRTIRRQMQNMNFLIQSLLKLSEFDADAITFMKQEHTVGELATQSMQNVESLCDLRNVRIIAKGDTKALLTCDKRWQVEAITNILKNAVEHSKDGSVIELSMGQNPVYTWISIRDYGEGMDLEDQKHIFDRFYKGKHSKPDSIGIGLSLAKCIVESENGSISVESDENGTTFLLRYYEVLKFTL